MVVHLTPGSGKCSRYTLSREFYRIGIQGPSRASSTSLVKLTPCMHTSVIRLAEVTIRRRQARECGGLPECCNKVPFPLISSSVVDSRGPGEPAKPCHLSEWPCLLPHSEVRGLENSPRVQQAEAAFQAPSRTLPFGAPEFEHCSAMGSVPLCTRHPQHTLLCGEESILPWL